MSFGSYQGLRKQTQMQNLMPYLIEDVSVISQEFFAVVLVSLLQSQFMLNLSLYHMTTDSSGFCTISAKKCFNFKITKKHLRKTLLKMKKSKKICKKIMKMKNENQSMPGICSVLLVPRIRYLRLLGNFRLNHHYLLLALDQQINKTNKDSFLDKYL